MTNIVELTTPACLLLGLVQSNEQACELGITLQYPPIQMEARAARGLVASGARAELAYQFANGFYVNQRLTAGAEIELELAIPAMMGLGSDTMLEASIISALSHLHGLDAPGAQSLEAHAFAMGGLLLVDDAGAPVERREIAHTDENDDWAWVLVLPRVPSGTAEALEAERRTALRRAAPHLNAEAAQAAAALWPAVERDDIVAFAAALNEIAAQSHAALAASGQPHTLAPPEQTVLDIMRAHGALHCGHTLTGLGLYALVKGGDASRTMRRALTEHLGFFGTTVMASLCDNRGAQMTVRE